MTPEYDIAMLLATRGRTESLGRSVRSLIEMANHPERLQLMFAFDNDDDIWPSIFMRISNLGWNNVKYHSLH